MSYSPPNSSNDLFTPALLATEAWFDFSDTATYTPSSAKIPSISDKSANARNVSQGTTANQPSLTAASVDTLGPTSACATFSGSQWLGNSIPFLYQKDRFAIYAVVSGAAGNNECIVGEGNTADTAHNFCPLFTGNGSPTNGQICPLISVSGGTGTVFTSTGSTIFDGTRRIVRIVMERGVFSTYSNGVVGSAPIGISQTAAVFNTFALGVMRGSSNQYFASMNLYEMVITQDDAYGQEIEGYLAYKHTLQSVLPANHPYRFARPTKSVTSKQPPVVKSKIAAALLGDSITYYNSGQNSSLGLTNNQGYFVNYNALSNGRMSFNLANNLGVVGDTSGGMAARMTSLAALTFDVCFLLAGNNDVQNGVSLVTTKQNITQILEYICLTLGKRVVLLTVTPRTAGQWTDTQKSMQRDLNRWIMGKHGSYGGMVVALDISLAMADANGDLLAAATVDVVHPSAYGGALLGQAINTGLLPYYGAATPNFLGNNLLTNPSLTGTTGTVGSPTTGTVATGYTSYSSGGSGTHAFAKNTDGSQNLSMSVTNGTSSDQIGLLQDITSGYAVGDTLYAAAMVRFNGTPTNIPTSRLELTLTGTGVQSYSQTLGAQAYGIGNIAETYTSSLGAYLLVTPDLPLTNIGTGSQIEWNYRMFGDSSSSKTASGAVEIIAAGIFKR